MASGLLIPICICLALTVLRERLRVDGKVRAACAVDRSATAILLLLPAVMAAALAVVAPGYLQSAAAGAAGRWALGGAVLFQMAVNLGAKKLIDKLIVLRV